MSDIKLSVVVPMYGVEEYVAECLRSILRQPVEGMEVLVVNDCTRDSSARIAREFQRSDGRVRVIDHEKNMGLGAARNTGLRAARGEYVTFPDSDDIVAGDAYARMVHSLDLSGSDFATGPAEEFGAKRKRYWTTDSSAFDVDRTAVDLSTQPDLIEDHTAWSKIFRRSFLNEHRIEWPVGVKCEDVVPSARVYAAAKAVDVISDVVYHYRRRRDSITTALGSDAAFSDWVEQSFEALRVVAGVPSRARSMLARKVLVTELLASVRLDAAVSASTAIQDSLRDLVKLGCGYLSSAALTGVSAADRLRIGLIAGGHFTELGNWCDRKARVRRDDLEAATELVPDSLHRLLGFGSVKLLAQLEKARGDADRVFTDAGDGALDLSVVIPTHNVAEYLDETLRSILAARGVRFEVIVVDDWSTDGTLEVARRHAEIDARVRVFRSTGRGGGQARNLGIELARGRYLAFADGDDIVPPNAYRAMLLVAQSSDAEVVTAKHLRTFTTSTWDPTDRLYPLVGTIIDTSVSEYPTLVHPRTVWNRLYSREFWNACVAPFCGVPRANDIVPFTSAILQASSVASVPVFAYIYRARPGRGSMTAKLGEPSSIVSYMSEELTCARLISASTTPELIDKFWHTALVEDGWANLGKYLAAQREQSFGDVSVRPWVKRLLAAAPTRAFFRISPEQQAVWALVGNGETRAAEGVLRAMRRPASVSLEETIDLLEAVSRTRQLSSKALDFLLWKYLVRRLVDDRSALTREQAVAAIHAFRTSGRLTQFVAVPGTFEDSILRAVRRGSPEGILGMARPSPSHTNISIRAGERFVELSGDAVARAVSYRWLFLRSRGNGGYVTRIPVALVTLDESRRKWSARLPLDALDRDGAWELWCLYDDESAVRSSSMGLRLMGHTLQGEEGIVYDGKNRIAKRAIKAGRWEEAVAALEGKVVEGSASVEELMILARAHRKLLQYESAATALSLASEKEPTDRALRSQARRAVVRAAYQRSRVRFLPLPAVLANALR